MFEDSAPRGPLSGLAAKLPATKLRLLVDSGVAGRCVVWRGNTDTVRLTAVLRMARFHRGVAGLFKNGGKSRTRVRPMIGCEGPYRMAATRRVRWKSGMPTAVLWSCSTK